jgi:DNA-binding NtrC family response regulator
MTRNTKSKGEQDAPANDAACKRLSVMLVGGEQNHRSQLQHRLARHCGLVESADSLDKARQLAARCHFDFLVVEPSANGDWSLDWIPALKGSSSIILSAFRPDTELAIKALRAGVSDIVTLPAEPGDLIDAFKRHLSSHPEGVVPKPTRLIHSSRHRLVGDSHSIRQVKALIERVAASSATGQLRGYCARTAGK